MDELESVSAISLGWGESRSSFLLDSSILCDAPLSL